MANTLISIYGVDGNKVAPTSGVMISFTIPTTGWTVSGSYYVNTIEVSGMTANMNGVFGLSMSATDAQFEMACDCQFRIIAQSDPSSASENGTITVKASKVPTVAVPCYIMEFGDESA